jgi:serine/threonine-protein kinase
MWLAAAAVVLLFIIAVVPALRDQVLSGGAGRERKLAVLLFDNVGGDESQQAFSDGLNYSLTSAVTQLGRVDESLWVVPASEVHREGVASIRDARQLFGVNLALTGSVRRTAGNLQVTVNLVDANEGGRQLDSVTVEAPLDNLLSVESRILYAVRRMMALESGPADAARDAPTAVAAAYDQYLRGRGYLQRPDRPGNLDKAVRSFEGALAEDPDFALAVAGLGEAYLARHSATLEPRWLARAQAETQRAITLDESLAPAHVNLSMIHVSTGRHEQAIEVGKRALELDPLNAEAYRALADAYSAGGRAADAECTNGQAIDLARDAWLQHSNLGVFYLKRSRFDEALSAFRTVTDLVPDNEAGYRNMAAVYQITGRYDEAEEMLEKAVALRPGSVNLSNLGTLHFSLGRFSAAAAAYERAAELNPIDPIIRGNLADAYRAVPDMASKAPDCYRQAIELAERQLTINQNDPNLLLGLAVYSAKVGDTAPAISYLERARSLMNSNVQLSFQSAIVYELAGRRDAALEALGAAITGGFPAEEAARESDLASLLEDSRFEAIIAE